MRGVSAIAQAGAANFQGVQQTDEATNDLRFHLHAAADVGVAFFDGNVRTEKNAVGWIFVKADGLADSAGMENVQAIWTLAGAENIFHPAAAGGQNCGGRIFGEATLNL